MKHHTVLKCYNFHSITNNSKNNNNNNKNKNKKEEEEEEEGRFDSAWDKSKNKINNCYCI